MQNNLIAGNHNDSSDFDGAYNVQKVKDSFIAGNGSTFQVYPAVNTPADHWIRYFVTELVGVYVATLMADNIFFMLSGESYLDLFLFSYLFMCVGISFSYFIGLLISPEANLNPTFTIALACVGEKKWKYVPICIIAQYLGTIAAHATMYYAVNGDQYDKDDSFIVTFGVFIPAEKADVSNMTCFWNSVLFNAILIICILTAMAPDPSQPPSSHFVTTCKVCLIIAAVVGCSFPMNVQNNPALFFGGLIFCWWMGWPHSVLKQHGNYYWIGLAGPPVGVICALIFLMFYNAMVWFPPSQYKQAIVESLQTGRPKDED